MTETAASPPRGRPSILEDGRDVDVDPDDPDGRMFLLDREWQGMTVLTFSEVMEPGASGVVHLDGVRVPHTLRPLSAESDSWRLGVRTFGVLREHGTTHELRIEGFTAPDGRIMTPAVVRLVTRERLESSADESHRDLIARRVAEEGIVLLRNDAGVLPLAPGVLNVLGRGLEEFRSSIVGAGKINPRSTVRLREAIERHPTFDLNAELADFSAADGDALPDSATLRRAASRSAVGIVVVSRASGENSDNSSRPGEYALNADERALVSAAVRAFERTVVILNTPYPIDVAPLEAVDAVVWAGIGGMHGGTAIVRVLDGTITPSGKLADTWPSELRDLPAHANFYDPSVSGPRLTGDSEVWIDTVYEEGLYVGYRATSTFDIPVAFPFGHGLSYTTFDIAARGAPQLTDRELRVGVTVTNDGPVPGREVVQLYVQKPTDVLEHPSRELVGFVKTAVLTPGESVDVDVVVPTAHLRSFDPDRAAWVTVEGDYTLHLGHSVRDATEVGTVRPGATVHRETTAQIAAPGPIAELSRHDPEGTRPTGRRSGIRSGATRAEPVRVLRTRADAPASGASEDPIAFRDVQSDPRLADAYAAHLTDAQLARLTVCARTGWGVEGTGVAGVLAQPEGLDVPLFQVADGNSGINVTTPNIGLPATTVLAATFDTDLAAEAGRVLGEEARLLDVDLVLAPALNLHRHPLNGRHPEYFSEDPLLSGVMAGHFARGLESTGVGACYKHVAANNAESARKRNQSLVSERALRELYLRGFEVALGVHHAVSMMSSYNAVNGRQAAVDSELLRGVLREEFAFAGAIMTDWNAYDTSDVVEIVRGGNNWITPGSADERFTAPLLDAIADGRLTREDLRASVATLLRTVAAITARRV